MLSTSLARRRLPPRTTQTSRRTWRGWRSRTPCAGITQIRFEGLRLPPHSQRCALPCRIFTCALKRSTSGWSYRAVIPTGSLGHMTATDVPRDATQVPQGASVDEKQARQVAEAAREAEWRKPSFGKELFLGRLRMNLIDPWPTPDPERTAKAEEFIARLGEFARTIDGGQIGRDAPSPGGGVHGPAG